MENSNTRLMMVVMLVLAVVATAAVTTLATQKKSEEGGAALDEAAVEAIIYNYLKENPESIVTAFNEARDKREQEEMARTQEEIEKKMSELNNDAGTPYAGAANGDITIVEFFDYNCGYCKRVTPDLIKLIEEDKGVKLAIKDFPILSPQSMENAKGALAVHKIDSGKFLDFHIAMMKTTPRNNQQLYAMAEKHGIAQEDLKKAMEDPAVTNQIRKNMALGQSIGVRGTPFFVVNGQPVRGAVDLEQFKQIIKSIRENG